MMIHSALEAAIQRYESAIAAIEKVMTEQSVEAIAREIHAALNALNVDATNHVETQNIDEEINKIIDTAAKELTNEQILEVLTSRDAVQLALSQETPIFTGKLLERLKRGDRYLKSRKWLELISQIDLGEWREIFHPPETAWWWYLKLTPPPPLPEPITFWNRLDWLWNFLTWVFLTISVSLVGEMATQVFSGDADNAWGILALVSPTVLTFVSGKQALTEKGREDIKLWLESWNIDRKYTQEARCIICFLICGSILIFYNFLVPNIANYLGQGYEKSGRLDIAQEQYELAVNFKYIPAYPNLARVLVNQGKSQYETADKIIREGLKVARSRKDKQNLKAIIIVLNQLAREYNKQKNTTNTIPLVHEGWQNILSLPEESSDRAEESSDQVSYDLMINYSWAYLNKADYNYAEAKLESARYLANKSDKSEELQKQPDHYCLLGMVHQKLNQSSSSFPIDRTTEKKYWEECIKFSRDDCLEEVEWRQEAQKQLSILEKSE